MQKRRCVCVRRSPLNVEFLGEELPVLALGVGSVEGGADALPNGWRDFEGFGARLGGDRAVGLHKKWERLFLLLEKHHKANVMWRALLS